MEYSKIRKFENSEYLVNGKIGKIGRIGKIGY
jgi:hypothetical protein